MRDERLSRLLWEIRTRFDRQLLEEEAIDRYGVDTVKEAQDLALVEVDDGTHWGLQRVLYLTRAGGVRAKAGRAMPFVSRTSQALGWLRAAFSGLPPGRRPQ